MFGTATEISSFNLNKDETKLLNILAYKLTLEKEYLKVRQEDIERLMTSKMTTNKENEIVVKIENK
jgi:hypothetical protein